MRSSFRSKSKVAILTIFAFGLGYGAGSAKDELVSVTSLFASSETVLGEAIAYPSGKPLITGAILTLQPGAETGWHTHGAPPAGIVLDGELTVDYGDKGKRTYKKGDALVETMSTPHNGKNTGTVPMRLFVVFVGSEGVPNTTKLAKP